MRVLVTGASGYVGSRVIPVLLDQGHEVRASFTDPQRAEGFWWAPQCEVVAMDIAEEDQVRAAVDGVDAVLYLIHSMAGDDFAEKDAAGARTMMAACTDAGVNRIVYLSGIVPQVDRSDLSEHIASRLEVEEILTDRGGPITTITLRAAVVVGSGSTSFEIIRQISERLPVQTMPTWMDSAVQPIAVTDVCAALAAAVQADSESRAFDVAGPEAMPYAELLQVYADVADITRPQVKVPGLPSDLVGVLAGALTDAPSETVEALIESLHHDMVASEIDFIGLLLPPDAELVGVREGFTRALQPADESVPIAERDPMGPMPFDPDWSGGQGGGLASAVAAVSAVASTVVGKLTPGQS